MKEKHVDRIAQWLSQGGLTGQSESDLLSGFCRLCHQFGLAIGRAVALMDTLHPVYEGRIFRWDSTEPIEAISEYGTQGHELAADNWQRSAFHYLQNNGENEVRRRLAFGDPANFFNLDILRDSGHTDFIAFAHRFGETGSIGEMNCFFSYFTTTAPSGFCESDLVALRSLVAELALASKCTAVAGIARTIATVYLGEDVAHQVLHGKITRGKAERISTVVWYSDLASYTRISDTSDPNEIIPLLNDYSDAVISSVHEAGGNVLKLIGDGTLAIFKGPVASDACSSALAAYSVMRKKMRDLNAQRQIEGRPVTDVYLGLHMGEVFYGNIGSRDRLDFTVVGRAVNEASRIADMCHSADRNVLISSSFVEALPLPRRTNIVSVGRYALRGVNQPLELFTLACGEEHSPSTDTRAGLSYI